MEELERRTNAFLIRLGNFPQAYSKFAFQTIGGFRLLALPETNQVMPDQRVFLLMISPVEERTAFL